MSFSQTQLNREIDLKFDILFHSTCVLTILFSYCFLDRPIAVFCENICTSITTLFSLVSLMGLGHPWLLFACFIIIFSYFQKNDDWMRKGKLFLYSLIGSGTLSILKPIFGRSRPDLFFRENIYEFKWLTFQTNAEYWSFPSGHAATITGMMLICIYLWPKWKIPFIFCMITISFSRIVINQHYLSDVLCGMYLSYNLTQYIIKKFQKIFLTQ